MKATVAGMVRLRRLRRDSAEAKLAALRRDVAQVHADIDRLTNEIANLIAGERDRYHQIVSRSEAKPYPSQIGLRLSAERAAFETESGRLARLRESAARSLELLREKEVEARKALKKAEQQKTKWEEVGQREQTAARSASAALDESELDELNTSLGD